MDDGRIIQQNIAPRITFKFRTNAEAPRGKVAVTELKPGTFLVMAQDELSDAQITMAIAKWCSRHADILNLFR